MHEGKSSISEDELKDIFQFFDMHDNDLLTNKKLNKEGFWQVLLGKDSLPLTKEPWGAVSVVDLVSGKSKGSIKVGESVDSNGKAYESSIIFGGLEAQLRKVTQCSQALLILLLIISHCQIQKL